MQGKEKIHLLMPMGGNGTRFECEGFDLPKPLIELQRKPFFYWSVQSILKFMDVEDLTFVVLKEHIEKFAIDKKLLAYYPNAKIHMIPQVLNGAVLTCLEGIKKISDHLPVLFNDCDHAFLCNSFYEFCKKANFNSLDGALLTFYSQSPNYSYVKFDSERKVIGTVEKKVISDEAICGAYYFKNKEVFADAAETYLDKCEYKEFFISGLYNVMAEAHKKVITFKVNEHISFGTPHEYYEAVRDKRLKTLDGLLFPGL